MAGHMIGILLKEIISDVIQCILSFYIMHNVYWQWSVTNRVTKLTCLIQNQNASLLTKRSDFASNISGTAQSEFKKLYMYIFLFIYLFIFLSKETSLK